MQQDRHGSDEAAPHVFDQTNGVLAEESTGAAPAEAGRPDTAIIGGFAMLSTQRP